MSLITYHFYPKKIELCFSLFMYHLEIAYFMMTNNTQDINTELNGQRLETVKSFRYLGSIITDEGSKPEILARIAQTAALTRLKPLWNDRNISQFENKADAFPCHVHLSVRF